MIDWSKHITWLNTSQLKHAVLTCKSTFIFLRFSCNIQTLSWWGQNGELSTSYQVREISLHQRLKKLQAKVALWLSLVIGQNMSHQLATSSKNLFTSSQFFVKFSDQWVPILSPGDDTQLDTMSFICYHPIIAISKEYLCE